MPRTCFAAGLALAALLPVPAIAQAAPAGIDPCTLLTVAEVSAAVGQPVAPGRPSSAGVTKDGAFSTTCLWQAALPEGVAPDPSRSLGGRSFAILNVQSWPDGADGARKFLHGFRQAFAEGDIAAQPVPVEVGADEAIWWGDGVAARKGGVSIGISVASAGDRALRRPRAESLAKLIVARLGGQGAR
jgi:hypothetical protein